jgi:hypothetical protein
VASTINTTPVGVSIAISDLVAAATNITGVASVTVVSPSYGVGNDLIPVQPFEKALVLDIDSDVSISFVDE